MQPVKQTNTEPYKGDCFAACIASVLELPLADVPNFCGDGGDWWTRFQDWLRPLGLFAVEVCTDGPVLLPVPSGAWVILSGKSPRGDWLHSVVGRSASATWWDYVHDPHPSNDMLDGNPKHALFFASYRPETAIGPRSVTGGTPPW